MMIILSLAVVGATAYVWSTRGFFSALIHMVCVLVAGAVAFGVWEPLALLILENSPDRGFASFLSGMAWGLALALPFAITLAILRGIIDTILPANAQCEKSLDFVGGGVCGLVSGVISAGIILLSLGYLRLETGFGGYRPVTYTTDSAARGSLERNKETFVPWADRITAAVYTRLSETTLSTGEPLAKWRPDLVTEPGAIRTTYEGKSRNTYPPGTFTLDGWYIIGDPVRGGNLSDLLKDSWNNVAQKVVDLDGEPLINGYLAGFAVKFNAKAREKTGQVIVGSGQVRLVVRNDDEESKALHPAAVVTNIDDPTRVDYARFRFDSDEYFIGSVGAMSDVVMAFEFAIPTGYKPLALYVKGVRVELEDQNPTRTYTDTSARDTEIQEGKMIGMGDVGPVIDPNTGQPVQAQQPPPQFTGPTTLVSNSLGFIIQKGTERSLTVREESRGWSVVDGDVTWNTQQLRGVTGGGIPPNLQINRFATSESTAVVQVDLSPSRRDAEFTRKVDLSEKNAAPVLVDTNGQRYPALGFIYKDSSTTRVRFTTGSPLVGLSEAPTVSRSTPNRQLMLVFSVSLGVEIKEFQIGDAVIEEYSPPIKADTRQR